MEFSWEKFYGASAGRNGLTALVPAPSSSWTITGTNWVEPPRSIRIIKNALAVTDTVANVVAGEYAINASHDPNYLRHYAFSDQTRSPLAPALLKMNYPLIDGQGNTAIYRTLETNANNAEICDLFIAHGDEGFKGLTSTIPALLPSNCRWMTATATITSVLGAWVSGAITLNGNLNPKSTYRIYGAGCTALAANTLDGFRFVPKADSTPSDKFPGAPAGDSTGCMTVYYEATGQPWLTFSGANPPDLAISAVTAAAQAPVVMMLIAEV